MSLVQSNQGGVAAGVPIDREAILQALNLNPRDPKVQALVLVCQQYGLDPVLKHAVLIAGNLYVTRDGLLHVAHRDGRLDGIVVEEEGENDQEWWARVAVHVKGQSYPYTYQGRYPKNGQQKRYGPEMAVKCAEVMALRRAFGITGIATVEEQWDAHDSAIAAAVVPPPDPGDPPADPDQLDRITDALNALPDDRRRDAKTRFVQLFGMPQHLRRSQLAEVDEFITEIMAGPAKPTHPDGEGGPASDGQEAGATSSAPVEPSGVNGASAEGPPPAPPEHANPVSVFHDAVKAAVPRLTGGATDSDLRHAVVRWATNGATEDWRLADRDEALPAAAELAVQVTEGSMVLALRAAGGFELRPTGQRSDDGPTIGYLRELIGRIPGLGEARTLTRAKKIARDLNLPEPTSFDAIDGPVLEQTIAEASKKIAEQSKENPAA